MTPACISVLSWGRTSVTQAGKRFLLACLVWCSLVVCVAAATSRAHHVTRCGGYVNGTNGFIQTPHFPRRFPVPISCQWVIHAPPGKKIVLYFTQYYMRESFKLTEFDHYENNTHHRGKHDLGEVSFEEEVISFTVYKPYLMLRFQVEEIGNIHLRVFDFLLDVYGFNITYEIVDRKSPIREDACSVFKCSFLGNCLAQRNFETYKCHCFRDFFGDDCQYGPYCNPDKDINMCKNGGKCRYFFGSLVNTCECPPAYHGVQCEKKREDYVDSVCVKMGCNQKCVKVSDEFRCSCDEGYRLKDDNKTCIEKGRMRYNCKMRCKITDHHGPVLNETILADCPDFHHQFTELIRSQLVPQLKEFQNFSGIDVSLGESDFFYMHFLFMGEKADEVNVWNVLYEIVKTAKVCSCLVDSDYLFFDSQPALHMVSLQHFDNRPVMSGHLLTLICRAKGSDGLHFDWFKDGASVNVHWTTRNMWQTKIPSSDEESRMSVLNIDHAHYLDAGLYTCKVTDWNETKSREVSVTVIKPPNVSVTPLAVTVMEGQTTKCKCLSSDDERGEFSYRWRKGKAVLGSREKQTEEVVEDLYPTGSRLTVRAGKETEMYTCVITAPSGNAEESCQITVTEVPVSVRSCAAEKYDGLSWQRTSENGTDIQRCPGNEKLKATRKCRCSLVGGCEWQEPNFAHCVSPRLELIRDELAKLQLGYVATDVSAVVTALQQFLRMQDTTHAFMGNLDLAAKLLFESHYFMRKHYQEDVVRPTIFEVIETASVILQRSRKGSAEERLAVTVGIHLMKLTESVRRDARVNHDLVSTSPMTAKSMELRISRIPSASLRGNVRVYTGKFARVSVSLSAQESTLSRKRRRWRVIEGEKSIVATLVYENLQDLLSNASLSEIWSSLNSQVVFVAPYEASSGTESVDMQETMLADIQFTHYDRLTPEGIPNLTSCVHWEEAREELGGRWQSGRCTVLQNVPHFTRCRCRIPGHFALATLNDLSGPRTVNEKRLNAITLAGCIVSLAGFLATVLSHICFWSQMKHDPKAITINICVAAIMLVSLLIIGLSRPPSEILCRAIMLMIAVVYLATLSFLVVDVFHLLYGTVKDHIELSPIKVTLCGWGLPLVALVVTLGCGELIGYSRVSDKYCWLSIGTWELYAFTAPASIMLTIYLWLLAQLVREATCRTPVSSRKERWQYILHVTRSALMLGSLGLSCVMNILIVGSSAAVYQILSSIAIATLGMFCFVVHCVQTLKVRQHKLVATKHFKETSVSQPSGFFQAFLEPRRRENDSVRGTDKGKTEEVEINSTRNGNKLSHTKEPRDQMRALLAGAADSRKESHSRRNDIESLERSLPETDDENDAGSSKSTQNRRPGRMVPVGPARGQSFIRAESAENAPPRRMTNDTRVGSRRSFASSRSSRSFTSSRSSEGVPVPFPGLHDSGESFTGSVTADSVSRDGKEESEAFCDKLKPVKSYILIDRPSQSSFSENAGISNAKDIKYRAKTKD